jgi:23S rRNA (uracil1939-C5)-methyltransferase
MKKNDEIKLNIIDMTAEGNGIGRHEGQAVFVPHTAPGDEVLVKIIKVAKNYAVGRLLEVVTPASCRIEPDCDVCKPCGGCAYRHITYEAECDIKRKRVNDCLSRIGGLDVQVEEMIPSPVVEGYRNKAQFPVGLDEKGEPVLGFYAPRSHRIVPTQNCRLQPDVFDRLCEAFLSYMKEQNLSVYDPETGKGLVRHFYLRIGFATGQVMACVVVGNGNLPKTERLIHYLTSVHPEITGILVNCNPKPTNVILGEKTTCIYGKETIDDVLMDVTFTLSLHSFYQVNPAAATLLFERAAQYADVGEKDTVMDLYCGAGAVGFCAGKKAGHLIGVEIVPQAVENAKENARRMGRENCEFLCMDASQAADQLAKRSIKPDVVFVDPPRKGCDKELLETIAYRLQPKKLVYISCDPATLARDAAVLKNIGYQMEKATAVDLFPRTPHVETVALFCK